MSCGREKQHRLPELMEMMTDILFTNRLIYSPNNNTIIVNKRIANLILHSCSLCRLWPEHTRYYFFLDEWCVSHQNQGFVWIIILYFFHNRVAKLLSQFLSLTEACLVHKIITLSHIIHALQHCYPVSVLMNSFPQTG